jgi:hypothetical protein
LRTPQRWQSAAPRLRNRNGTSGNWSGYTSETSLTSPQNGAVTDVRGCWTIPAVSASGSAHTYSSFWIGIDGYSDNTVEQIGTEQDWTTGGQANYVWFEMYPKGAYLISGFPIVPGDKFGARVEFTGNSTFVLSITNYTRNTAYTVPTHDTRARSAKRSSAEWVVEAPYSGGVLPLADFGTGSFNNCVATFNGTTGPIDDAFWQDDAITMETSGGAVKAQPSGLTDSTANGTTSSAFSVTWYHE